VVHAWDAVVEDAENMRGSESIGNGLIFTFGHKTVFFLFDLGLCRHHREKPLGSQRDFTLDWPPLLPRLVSTKLCEYIYVEWLSTASHSLVRYSN
jgi:hypothetical protein